MNKNKKITMAILVGLTTFSMVGCGSKTAENTEVTDLEINFEGNEDSTDLVEDNNAQYTEDEIRADFKIIENMSIEFTAASVNDAFIAALASVKGTDVNDNYLYMDKEIEACKKNAESIKVPQIKKIADIYIDSFQKQSELVKQLAKGEIDEAGLTDGVAKITEELASALVEDLTLAFELQEILDAHGLLMTDLLDSYAVQTEAQTLAQEKYSENMQNFTKELMK